LQLATELLDLSTYFLDLLRPHLLTIPLSLLALPPHLTAPVPTSNAAPPHRTLPSPIIPILTPYPRPLSEHLRARGLNARPITWPTVAKGRERVRVCLHAGNARAEVEWLVGGMVEWAEAWMSESAGADAGSLEVESRQGDRLQAKL